MNRSERRRRPRQLVGALVAALSGALLVSGLPVIAAPALAAATQPPKVRQTAPVSGRVLPVKSPGPDRTRAAAVRQLPKPTWPGASTSTVALTAAGASGRPAGSAPGGAGAVPGGSGAGQSWVRAGTSAVSLADPRAVPGTGVTAAPAAQGVPATVQVRTFDRAAATRAGVDGVLLAVSRAGGGTGAVGQVGVRVDYSGFAGAAGGDWASRLRLVSLPECALSTPERLECRTQTPVASSRNDLAAKSVTAVASIPAPVAATPAAASAAATGARAGLGGVRVLAVTAAASGPAGSYAATNLSPSASWQVGTQTGDFTWSYPLGAPPSVYGPKPALTLAYSSGAIDGRVTSTNNQSSWVGDGFDLEIGYVERRYVGCSDDKAGGNNSAVTISGDLCWRTDNASLVLAGHSGELVKDAATGAWKLKNDDGTRVERLTGGTNADKFTEYWRVTTPDGTQYFFGLGKRYAADTVNTQSTYTVPVAGNHSGEPCYTTSFATSFCTRAWRWNLDYVVDPFGNSMTYFYTPETNNYGQRNNAKVAGYVRGGYLTRIEYGERKGGEATTVAPAQVVFGVAERCLGNGGTVTCTPAQLTAANASFWPDVPFDQICASTTSCPGVVSPAFFSRKRLTSVTTQVRSGTAYSDVDVWNLSHLFPATGDGTSPALWLSSLSHTGKAGGTPVTLPSVDFTGVQLANRVDKLDADPSLIKWRISSIASETGSSLAVNYLPAECSATKLPAAPATNTMRCFPVFWTRQGASSQSLTYFHKYPVASITETDLTGGGSAVVTSYSYLDGAAYHYDDNALVQPKYRTWGGYRGYGRVQVITGDAQSTRTLTEHRFLRGMDGDCAAVSGTTCTSRKSVTVTDSRGGVVTDHERANGWQLEKTAYNGVGGPEVSGEISTPWISAATATNGSDKAYLMGAARTVTRTRLASGADRTTRVDTTYDSTYGMATQIDDLGDTATGVRDEKCTRLTYARNTSLGIVNTVSRIETVSVSCGTTPNRPGDLTSDVRTFYDGQAGFGAAPTKGSVTRTEAMTGWDTAAVYSMQNTTTYDVHGRVLTATDALGRTTTTAYTPATGGPVTAVTTTNPLQHANTTTLDPARGMPIAEVDANNNRTDLLYDGLGRLVGVWMPGRAKATQTPNFAFRYAISKTAPAAVTSKELRNKDAYTYTDRITLFDGLLRPRQTQAPAEGGAGGRIITETRYDSRGLAVNQNGPFYASGAPATSILDVTDVQKEARNVVVFDGAARPTTKIFLSYGTEKWRTTTSYEGDRVSVTPPSGGTPTTTISDARGRVTALRQYKGATPAGAFDETTYGYRPDGLKASMTAAGSTWTYGYDLRGRLTSTADPDRGTTTTTYDAGNRVVSNKDARGKTLFYEYDSLDRRTAVREGSADGPVISSWVYDTLAKGKLTSSTRHVGSEAYVQAVTGYDQVYRPTGGTVTIPAGEGKLAGTYTTSMTYNVDGGVKTLTPAALPGLPNETQAFGYDALGNPFQMQSMGVGSYVSSTTYSVFGEALQYSLGPTIGKSVWQTRDYDPGTHRLTRVRAQREGVAGADADLSYTYDDAGTLTRITDAAPGQAQSQCFEHDYLQRLTQAWTATDGCAGAPSLSVLGGPAPYWTSWTYDAAGNRRSQVEHAAAGDTTSTYTYPAADAAHPHAVQQVATTGPAGSRTDVYGYDETGNTATRTLGGAGQTLTWDTEGHLATHTKGAASTSFLYDADGARLIRREPGSVTLYLDNAEVTLDKATDTVSATRYYVFNGETVAVRTAAGLKLLISDHQGTAQLAVDAVSGAVARRRFDPFGQARGEAADWTGQRGFVGGVQDPTTGLTHLGAREYDPGLGRFISVDPVLTEGDPQQLQGYSYAGNSPVTHSDPTGLFYIPVIPIVQAVSRIAAQAVGANPSWLTAATALDNEVSSKLSAASQARAAQEAQKQRLIAAAKAAGKIIADELGITAGLDCFTTGNLAACGETALNVVSSFAGGMASKLIAKYGMPWNWAKGARLVERLWRLGSEAMDAFNGWRKAGEDLKTAQNAVDTARRAQADLFKNAASSCKLNSFTADTPVLLASGAKKLIGELKIGDKVKAVDTDKGTKTTGVVSATYRNTDTQFTDLTLTSSTNPRAPPVKLHTTSHHRIWDQTRRDFVYAADLPIGHHTLTDDGTTWTLTATRSYLGREPMVDITVTTAHTFFVATGPTTILVHNCGDAADAVPDPLPQFHPDGTPVRDGPAAWVNARDAEGNVTTHASSPGFHAEVNAQAAVPGARMSRVWGWRGPTSAPVWREIPICRDCQKVIPRELFPDNVTPAPGGAYGG